MKKWLNFVDRLDQSGIYCVAICFSLIGSIVSSFLNVTAILLFTSIGSQIFTSADLSNILTKALVCLLCYIGLYIFRYWESVSRTKVEWFFRKAYTNEVLMRIFEGKPDCVLQLNKSNIAFFANDLCRDYVSAVFLNIYGIINSIVTITAYLICFSTVLTKEIVALLVLSYSIFVIITHKLKLRISKNLSVYFSKCTFLNTSVNEIIDNSESIRLSGISGTVEKRLIRLINDMHANNREITKINTHLDLIAGIPNLVVHLALFWGAQSKIYTDGSLEHYLVIQNVSFGVISCFNTIFELCISYERQKTLYGELNKILSIERIQPLHNQQIVTGLTSVKLNQVQYNNTHFIIYPDMTFDKSKLIVVNGMSGSGKTTLLRLISGLLTPTFGSIDFEVVGEKVNLNTCSISMAYMPQSCYIFNSTVRENITLGKAYSDAQIYEALKMANAYEFIMRLPFKLETVLQMGNISGGERQRIALARMLIRKPELLILDESIAHLDTENCKTIIDNLKSVDAIRILTSHQSWIAQDKSLRLISLDGEE